MSAYWIEYTEILLPGLMLESISAIPLALGTLAAIRHLRAGRRGPYIKNLCGSIAAGFVTLALLWDSLFGDNRSTSPTAGLIFAFAPLYSAVALLVGYLIGFTIIRASDRTDDKSEANSFPGHERKLVWIPVLFLAVLMFGVTKYAILNNDLSVAAHASRSETLHYVLERATQGKADTFGVPLFLAQNPNAPADILERLSKSGESQVRAFVAANPNTPVSVVASLREDCADYVRKAARERLKDASGFENTAPQSAPKC